MRPTIKFEENLGQFKELILYISQKCANDQKFDTLKLSKLLFFSDFLAYGNFGRPITGFEYVKMEKGPAPKRIREVKAQMETERTLGLQKLPLREWKRPVNLRDPDLSQFSAAEISLVDNLIDALKETESDLVSALTHDWLCWKLTPLGQTIPYEMVFLSHEEPTPADIERGKAVARELNLIEQPVA
jgi:hypothetical protein